MKKELYEYGMIGLGTMGRNLVYNISDHGFSVAGFDKDKSQVDIFTNEAAGKNVKGFSELDDFIKSLQTPRVILLLVPAGKIVDSVIEELLPFLSEDDLLIDCGNSHFTDTDKRTEQLAQKYFHYMGTGISGGEAGARYGPSIMPGGGKTDYLRIAPVFEAIAAKVQGEPCVAWLGPGSAGHYVKMVHNGIEYGLMQLISETYNLLKVIEQLDNDELHTVFSKWNNGVLHSYLVGITADIFLQKDELTSNRLIDMIKDSAAQNGTGAWTSEDAMALMIPVPVIDIAVSTRCLSADKEDRTEASKLLTGPSETEKLNITDDLEQALYFAMIITYAQGMTLLQAASGKYNYNLRLEEIAKIWRGGCIIRASILDSIRDCFTAQPKLKSALLDKSLAQTIVNAQNGMRNIAAIAVKYGVAIPAFSAALAYYDSFRSEWLPANLIQAQRDCFGAHTYKRTDRDGIFHTHWNTKQS